MDELLKKLLESEVLSEDTKKEFETEFNNMLNEAVATAKKEAEEQTRIELTDKWVAERDALIEAIDAKVGEYLENEMKELKEDVERFRDLEAEHAEKLVEAKAAMAEEVKGDMKELVEYIDKFLEMRLSAEVQELHEDIEEIKKLEFGRKLYEGFAAEFAANYADEDGTQAKLNETETKLADAMTQLEESETARNELERAAKLDEVLSSLEGRQREVMETVLTNIPTDQLEEGYKTFIGRVLKESEETSEKEDEVLAEGSSEEESSEEAILEDAQIVSGDTEEEVITEDNTDDKPTLNEDLRKKLQSLAGIGK